MMMEILGGTTDLDYENRAQVLINNRIALWDTLKTCVRDGSLDSAIVDASIEINDFKTFFRRHPKIRHIFFNGQKSRQVYSKYVLPGLPQEFQALDFSVLPSSSPAMARLNRAQKTNKWRAVVHALENKSG